MSVIGDINKISGAIGRDVRGIKNDVTGEVRKLENGVDTSMGPLKPPPTLKRPVVMITGLTMQASSFDPMARHLASNPKNGGVAVYNCSDAKFHAGSAGGKVMTAQQVKQSKIFEVQYKDAKAAPSDKAPQIAQAMKAIQSGTGTGSVDAVCHSAGCTDFRLYLDQRKGADKLLGIDHAVFIGPASHGTEMGNLGGAVGGPMGLQKAGGELAVGSKMVNGLNQNWARQRSQVKDGVTIIGLEGAPTASPKGLVDGDGYMPTSSVGMPGAKTVLMQGINPTPLMHLWEVHYSGVINQVGDVLGS
jgi:hypothetical protein